MFAPQKNKFRMKPRKLTLARPGNRCTVAIFAACGNDTRVRLRPSVARACIWPAGQSVLRSHAARGTGHRQFAFKLCRLRITRDRASTRAQRFQACASLRAAAPICGGWPLAIKLTTWPAPWLSGRDVPSGVLLNSPPPSRFVPETRSGRGERCITAPLVYE